MRQPVCTSAIVLLLLAVSPLPAQRTEVVDVPSSGTVQNSYRIYFPTSAPEALLVLLPGYGGDVDSFDPSSSVTPSTLPARLAEHNVLTIVAVPVVETLYVDDEPLRMLDSIIEEVLRRYAILPERVVIGGFSAGGTGAVRYAQFCQQGKCRATARVAGVFAVDAPLDFPRLYRGEKLSVERAAPRANIAEANWILEHLKDLLGGSPSEAFDEYCRQSPLVASLPDGGNARLLASTPIRLYTEPDIAWWMENRSLDYYAINSVDHAALINLLTVFGNERAELITTTNQGYRPNRIRHPHSWSIVDEEDLTEWLRALVVVNSEI